MGPPQKPAFSFLIPSTGRPDGLARVLAALPGATRGLPFEILGTCPASDVATIRVFKDHGAQHVLDDALFVGAAGGFSWSRALQAMLKASRGGWFCYGSDDVIFPPGSIAGAMAAGSLLGVAGVSLGQIERWPGRPDRGPFAMRSLNRPMVNYGVIARDAAEVVEGFDPVFDFYAGDWDLCMRIQAAGAVMIELPDVAVLHEVVEDTSRAVADQRRDADEGRYADRWLAHPFAGRFPNLSTVVPRSRMRSDLIAALPELVAQGRSSAVSRGRNWDADASQAAKAFPMWESFQWILQAAGLGTGGQLS